MYVCMSGYVYMNNKNNFVLANLAQMRHMSISAKFNVKKQKLFLPPTPLSGMRSVKLDEEHCIYLS